MYRDSMQNTEKSQDSECFPKINSYPSSHSSTNPSYSTGSDAPSTLRLPATSIHGPLGQTLGQRFLTGSAAADVSAHDQAFAMDYSLAPSHHMAAFGALGHTTMSIPRAGSNLLARPNQPSSASSIMAAAGLSTVETTETQGSSLVSNIAQQTNIPATALFSESDPTQEVFEGHPRPYTDHNIVAQMKRCVLERNEGQFTLVNYKKSGEPFLNHVTMIPLALGGSKEFTHIIGLQIDLIQQPKSIMERLKNGTYLVNYHQDQALSSQASTTSHGIHGPLTVDTEEFGSHDVTGISKAVQPIQLSFLEKMSDFIHVLSLRGLFLHVSPEPCKRLLEWDQGEIVGHKISEFVHPSDLVTVMRDLRNCSAEGSVNFICRMKRKRSGYIYMEMNGHVYSGSKRNRCFIITGRERPALHLPMNLILKPEANPSAEAWIKISPEGLVLFATATSSFFFARNTSALVATSLFEWIDASEHASLVRALECTVCTTVPFHLTVQGVPVICHFRFLHVGDEAGRTIWIQIKRQGIEMAMPLASDSNLFHVIQSVRSSSIYYECNKIRVRNTRLQEEITRLLRAK
ncbi:blue light receptor [Kappamyces sp. JEL0680]|nr:blue light receptor [Kappamyces sp. JEL0680]